MTVQTLTAENLVRTVAEAVRGLTPGDSLELTMQVARPKNDFNGLEKQYRQQIESIKWYQEREESLLALLDEKIKLAGALVDENINLKGDLECVNGALHMAKDALEKAKAQHVEVERLKTDLEAHKNSVRLYEKAYENLHNRLNAFEPVKGGPIHVPYDRTAIFRDPQTFKEYKFSMVPDPKNGTTLPFTAKAPAGQQATVDPKWW